MKRYIGFIFGFLCAAILFSTTPIKAASDILNAYFNNEQKVAFNGVEKNITIVNVDGYNYGKIRDIIDAVGGTTSYNNATQTIEVATTYTTLAVTPTPSPSSTTTINTIGGTNMSKIDTNQWILIKDFYEQYNSTDFAKIVSDNIKNLPKSEGEIKIITTELGDITFELVNGRTYVKIADLKTVGLLN